MEVSFARRHSTHGNGSSRGLQHYWAMGHGCRFEKTFYTLDNAKNIAYAVKQHITLIDIHILKCPINKVIFDLLFLLTLAWAYLGMYIRLKIAGFLFLDPFFTIFDCFGGLKAP